MADNISTLGIEVKTSGVAQAASDLQKLSQAATSAEKSTGNITSGIDKVNAQLSAMGNKAKGAGTAFKALDPVAQTLGKVAKEADNASGAMSKIGSNQSLGKIGADASKAADGIRKASNELDRFTKESKDATRASGAMSEVFSGLKRVAGGLFAGFSVAQFAGKLITVQREFDKLNSSLITITGSSSKAEREFAWIKDFAAETPFSLTEVTTAFVKLKNLGLDATKESLISYGNTASAMGKSLDQMIEAVADASTGEFERLKEFGIRAEKSGDEVSLTFQGTTKTIKNSAEEIGRYLTEIGNNNFAGAMAERAKTLDGAISNLGDSWDELFRTINQNNAGGLIFDSVKLASGALDDLIKILNAANGAVRENASASADMASKQELVRNALKGISLLALGVSQAIQEITLHLGGLGAVAFKLSQFDFQGAKDVGAEWGRKFAEGRDAYYKKSGGIIGAGKFNNDLSALSDGLPSVKPKGVPSGGGDGKKKKGKAAKESEEAKAYEDAMKSLAKIERDAEKSTLDLTAAQSTLYDLQNSPVWAKMPQQWRDTAIAQMESAKAAEEQAKFLKAVEAQEQANVKSRQSMIQQIQDAEKATEMYGLTAAQVSVVEQSRIADAIAILEQDRALKVAQGASEAELDTIQKRIDFLREEFRLRGQLSEALGKKEGKQYEQQDAEKSIKGTKDNIDILDEYAKSAARNIQSSFADFLFDPFDKGIKGMAEQFGNILKRMAAEAAAAQVMKSLFGNMGGTAKGSSGGGDWGWIGTAADWVMKTFKFHEGGIVGAGGSTSFVHPMVFANAQRFHDGGFPGLKRDEVPAILQRGERVLTKEQQRARMGNIVINVNSTTGDRAEIRRAAATGARQVLGIMGGSRRYG